MTDTGPGIPAEHQTRIFDQFHQVDSSNTKAKGGTGLGLAIAKQIVEMHGGRIWVESTLGRGSTFQMELPTRAKFWKSNPGRSASSSQRHPVFCIARRDWMASRASRARPRTVHAIDERTRKCILHTPAKLRHLRCPHIHELAAGDAVHTSWKPRTLVGRHVAPNR